MTVTPYALHDLTHPRDAGEALRVETTTLLPGGALATLSVRQIGTTYAVMDDDAAREALLALGIEDLTSGDTRRGNEIAAALGLSFSDAHFGLDNVSAAQLPAAIAYVADACRAWIGGTLEARSRRTDKAMVESAFHRIRSILPGLQIDVDRELPGASTKRHRFDLVVTLPRERFALFESVLPAAASLASVHLKFYDLKQASGDWPREALIEDFAIWPSEDLAIMQQVATHVRDMNDAWTDLQQLAA